MNNALKYGLNYRVSQDPTVRTTLFQLQQPLSVQTTTPLPGGTPIGPSPNATLDPQPTYPQTIYPQPLYPQAADP